MLPDPHPGPPPNPKKSIVPKRETPNTYPCQGPAPGNKPMGTGECYSRVLPGGKPVPTRQLFGFGEVTWPRASSLMKLRLSRDRGSVCWWRTLPQPQAPKQRQEHIHHSSENPCYRGRHRHGEAGDGERAHYGSLDGGGGPNYGDRRRASPHQFDLPALLGLQAASLCPNRRRMGHPP